MDNLVSAVINVVLVGLIVFYMKQNKTALEKKVDKVETRLKDDEENYLTEKNHQLLCENSHLNMEKMFNKQLNKFKDEIFDALRNLEKAVKNGHTK